VNARRSTVSFIHLQFKANAFEPVRVKGQNIVDSRQIEEAKSEDYLDEYDQDSVDGQYLNDNDAILQAPREAADDNEGRNRQTGALSRLKCSLIDN